MVLSIQFAIKMGFAPAMKVLKVTGVPGANLITLDFHHVKVKHVKITQVIHVFNSNSIVLDCGCDPDGSSSMQCQPDGKCTCKEGFTGDKCDLTPTTSAPSKLKIHQNLFKN